MLKGFVPVLLGVLLCDINSFWFALVIIAPTLGHSLGIFSNFQGGKCIATIFGEMIALTFVSPILFILAAIFVLFCIVPGIHSNKTRSVITFSCFMVVAFVFEACFGRAWIGVGCSVCALISIISHLKKKEAVATEVELDQVADAHK